VDASDFLKKQGYEVSHVLLPGSRYGEAPKSMDLDGLMRNRSRVDSSTIGCMGVAIIWTNSPSGH